MDTPKMIQVTQEDGNDFCRILTLLGMEEEGDPVAEIRRLIAVARIEPACRLAAPATVAEAESAQRVATTYGDIIGVNEMHRVLTAFVVQRNTPGTAGAHPHDVAVDSFAALMKSKMAVSRANGRSGWDDPAQCTVEHLSDLLRNSVGRGDPVDVANFAMMLDQRGSEITPAPSDAIYGDTVRLDWVMLILNGTESKEADNRAMLLAMQIISGLEGRAAIDASLKVAGIELPAAHQPATEPMLRFCPGCGSVGEVAGTYLDCCPDGSEARVIPAALANKCRSLFQMALADALAAKVSETPQTSLYSTKQATESKLCWSADEEEFCYDTLHELLASNDDLVIGDPVYVGDAITPDPATYIDADTVLEHMSECASDDCGEYAEDFPDVTPEAKESLNGFLKGWARKHCTPVGFYKVEKVQQHILTADDLAQ